MQKVLSWIQRKIQDQRFALCFLGLAVVCVFINILPNAFIMDDFDFITDWNLIQDIKNFPRFFIGYIPPQSQPGIYSPLRTVLFSLGYTFFGETPAGWHIVSMAGHFLGVWAVYALTQILAGSRRLSFLTALIFAVHPVHVESVTAVTGSIDTIGVVLGLWAFYWYIRAVLPPGTQHIFDEQGRRYLVRDSGILDARMYYVSLFLGTAAVFTHELIISLPVLLFMFDAHFSGSEISWKRAFKRTVPFLAAGVFYVLAKHAVLGSIARGSYAFDNAYLTFLVVIKAWAKYFGVLAAPIVLTHNKIISKGIMSFDQEDFDRAAFFAQSWQDPQVFFSFLLLLGVFAAGIFFYRKRPLISFCIFWFYFSLAPVAQIIPSSVYYAERYLYPGSWAYALVLAWGFLALYKKCSVKPVYRTAAVIAMTMTIVFYSARTVIRNRDFRDWITFYEKAVQANPQSAYLKNDLGILYSRRGDFESAEKYFLKALELQPGNAHFYFSIAEVYAASDRDQQAVDSLKKAVELEPDFPEAYFNLAGAMVFMEQEELAAEYLQKAVALWKKQDKILEAGEAVNAFYIFSAQRRGDLKHLSAEEFLKINAGP